MDINNGSERFPFRFNRNLSRLMEILQNVNDRSRRRNSD